MVPDAQVFGKVRGQRPFIFAKLLLTPTYYKAKQSKEPGSLKGRALLKKKKAKSLPACLLHSSVDTRYGIHNPLSDIAGMIAYALEIFCNHKEINCNDAVLGSFGYGL